MVQLLLDPKNKRNEKPVSGLFWPRQERLVVLFGLLWFRREMLTHLPTTLARNWVILATIYLSLVLLGGTIVWCLWTIEKEFEPNEARRLPEPSRNNAVTKNLFWVDINVRLLHPSTRLSWTQMANTAFLIGASLFVGSTTESLLVA